MKAVRGLLAVNLDVAQAGLVSKSDVENETYLFRAACSELSTEVRKNRRVADESMRQQRTTLQHEVDILTQTLNQEVLTLNDNVKGMFNDRRMAVREEQKAAESAVCLPLCRDGWCGNPFANLDGTDPAAQLQDQRHAQQRREVGGRGTPLGVDPAVSIGHRLYGCPDLQLAALCDLS